MKAVTIKELKLELASRTPKELRDLCLRLSRFKKENKELLTYLLFESHDEESYVGSVKNEIDQQFELVNKKSYYLTKKSLRKILLKVRKYARYSQNKKTEVDLLIYYCAKLTPFIKKHYRLTTIFTSQTEAIRKKILLLHEDLQYDYGLEINALSNS
jgi:hypothetical protein